MMDVSRQAGTNGAHVEAAAYSSRSFVLRAKGRHAFLGIVFPCPLMSDWTSRLHWYRSPPLPPAPCLSRTLLLHSA